MFNNLILGISHNGQFTFDGQLSMYKAQDKNTVMYYKEECDCVVEIPAGLTFRIEKLPIVLTPTNKLNKGDLIRSEKEGAGFYSIVVEVSDDEIKVVNSSGEEKTLVAIKNELFVDHNVGDIFSGFYRVFNPMKNLDKDDPMTMLALGSVNSGAMNNVLPFLMMNKNEKKLDEKLIMMILMGNNNDGVNNNMLPFLMMNKDDDMDFDPMMMFALMNNDGVNNNMLPFLMMKSLKDDKKDIKK